MSRIHIQQLSVVFREYEAVQAVVKRSLQDPSQTRYADLQQANRHLETTYTIRLFVEFEGILRFVLLEHDPRHRAPRDAYNRINRVARLYSVPDTIRNSVHEAREYRNSIVHSGGVQIAAITIGHAQSRLNRFLNPLP